MKKICNFDFAGNCPKNNKIIKNYELLNEFAYNSHWNHELGFKWEKIIKLSENIVKNIFVNHKNVDFVSGGGTMWNKKWILNM